MEHKHDLAKWLAGEMTPEELRAFEQTEDFELYNRIARVATHLEPAPWNEDEILKRVIAKQSNPIQKTPIFSLSPWIKWTSGIAAALVLGFYIHWADQDRQEHTIIADRAPIENILLPDASQVRLNQNSRITFSEENWKSDRTVKLDGEAYFIVAKGKTFAVQTDQGIVQVLGTEFNVKIQNHQLQVICYEGRVSVSHGTTKEILEAGSGIEWKAGKFTQYSPVYTREPEWIENKLVFKSAQLNEILSELKRQYSIEIQSDVHIDQKFTGTLPSDDFDTALKTLCATYNLNAYTDQNKVVLSVNE